MQVGGTEDGGHGRRGMEGGCPIRGNGDGAEDSRLHLQFLRCCCPLPGPRARMVAMLPKDPLHHSLDFQSTLKPWRRRTRRSSIVDRTFQVSFSTTV